MQFLCRIVWKKKDSSPLLFKKDAFGKCELWNAVHTSALVCPLEIQGLPLDSLHSTTHSDVKLYVTGSTQ
jgi:hypothetical protein